MRKLRSVLYVDDDPDICSVVKIALGLVAGWEVNAVSSGATALDVAQTLLPDLIVMDVMMPELDGPSTLKLIRQCPKIAAIPVIFMTAKVLPDEISHFLELGAIGVIGKPFDPIRLASDLSGLWDKAMPAAPVVTTVTGMLRLKDQVDTLAIAFLDRTEKDVPRLRSMVADGLAGDASVLGNIERLSHSIHGTGSLFGFPEISAAGAAIEHFVCETTSTGQTVSVRLLELVERLTRAVEAARHPGFGNANG